VREEPARTLLVGFDFRVTWPLAALGLGGLLLGLPTLRESLVMWAAMTAGATLAACLRGFRLEVRPSGFTHVRTWAGIPYWRGRVPLSATVTLAGDFGGQDDRVVIERALHREDIALGSKSSCVALHRAIVAARSRWAAAET
jgi:hypothetical protein